MRTFTIIYLIIMLASVLSAQIQWSEEGVPVRKGVNIEWYRSGITLEDGSVVYVWSDTRRGDRDVWAQKISATGDMLWGQGSNNPDYPDMVEGLLVNGEINRQEDPVVINTGDGGVIVAWVDFRNEDTGDIYAQKLDANGNLLWDPAGVPLCLAGDIQISLNIVNDTDGGAFVIWLDSRNPGGVDIYGTHILASGAIAAGWETNGEPVAAYGGSQNQHTFWEDGAGGAILVWHDTRNPNDENIYMQRISAGGDLLWNADGVLVCDAAGSQESPKISPLNDGNFMIAWRDKREDANGGDIFARKIDVDGNLLWDSDIAVYAGTGIQQNPRITQSSDGGAFIAWEDGRYDYTFKDIFIQKVSTSGDLLWPAAGLPVCTEANDQLNPRLEGNFSGGVMIIWDDGREGGHPNEDIYVQYINADGSLNMAANGELVCNAYGEQFSPLIKRTQQGDFFINWGDIRTGSVGMYVQILDEDGNYLLAENGKIIYYGLSGDAVNFQMFSNGNNAVLAWQDTRFSSLAMQIYLQVINSDGSVSLEADGQQVTAMTGYNQENMDAIFTADTELLAIVWEENRVGDKQIFAQAVDINGNFIWSADNGLNLCNIMATQEYPAISAVLTDTGYEYYVGWSDNRDWMTGSGIYAQKILADGALQWGPAGLVIADGSGDDQLNDVVEDYFIWHGGSWPNQDIYVKRVDTDGNTATGWPEEGLLICGATGFQENARGVMVPEGLLVVWEDKRSGTADLYGQIITPEGQIVWAEDGIPLNAGVNDQIAARFIYDDYLYMVWEDFRSGVDEDVYMQKFDATGTELWTAGGNEIIVADSAQTAPCLTKNSGNYLVCWQASQSDAGTDLYGQLMNEQGEKLWASNGYLICNAIKNQNKPQAVPVSNNMSMVIWQDTRSSGKTDIYNIYAQKVRMDLLAADDPTIPENPFTLFQNYPNPFNPETTITFSLPNSISNGLNLDIFNIKGQKIRSFPVGKDLARTGKSGQQIYSVIWNGQDQNGLPAANGIYFYQLNSRDYQSPARKMIMLK